AGRVKCPVEEHCLDAGVVVKVLQVAEVRDRGGDVGVQVRRAVAGDLQAAGGGHGGGAQPLGDTAAAGHVDLQAVNRLGVDHAGEVGQVEAVLPRGHIRVDLVPDLTQAV